MQRINFLWLLIFFYFSFLSGPFKALGQQADTLAPRVDTVKVIDTLQTEKIQREHSPKKAALLSAVLPGAGQFYNKKYWKIPIIYAGFGGLGYAVGSSAGKFRTYRDAYRLRVDGDSTTIDEFEGIYRDNDLLTLRDFYRRNLDISAIFTVVFYTLNILDAVVDAHLFNYDISDDLSLEVRPRFYYRHPSLPGFAGLNLTFRL